MFNNIKMSLRDLLGDKYIDAVSNGAKFLLKLDKSRIDELANTKIDFLDPQTLGNCDELLAYVGKEVAECFDDDNQGAPTEAFRKATKLEAAPISGIGCMRLGQDGRLYLTAKSEHYHTSLGHNFEGYRLITKARELGILNATHNNTRGFITRKMECELVRCINGLDKTQTGELESILASQDSKVLNRVINLETGSLAVEAGVKMMMTRFYRLDKTFDKPACSGKIPVFLVMADNMGGKEANYHGTTVITQTLRGMWPELYEKIEQSGIYKVVSVEKNDIEDFRKKIEQYNSGEYKTAGFLHEIILMNYGGIKLTEEYLQKAYELCKKYDTPTLVDEIQSCMWYKGMFLFKLYDLNPDFVILGKGFPGGEYPASKIITTYEMDSLNQFGALVTNGQEELASLAYLITMEFEQANEQQIEAMGDYLEEALNELKEKYSDIINKIEGKGHLAAIHFGTVKDAVEFAGRLNGCGIDISAQAYKADCPPAALIKLPLIAGKPVVDYLKLKMFEALEAQRSLKN
jgi:acetylornithine/succinyldiaminopimelate/putrescine aminotransferase